MKNIIRVPLVLLVLFYFSLSISRHHQNLLLSVYDFLGVSNSCRFVFFFVFNFAVIIISLASSEPSGGDFEGFFAQNFLLYDEDYKFQYSDNEEEEDDDDDERQGYDGYDEDNDDDDDDDIDPDDICSEDDENDADDNKLEKRAEEFIAKVKEKWREELLTDRVLCITAA